MKGQAAAIHSIAMAHMGKAGGKASVDVSSGRAPVSSLRSHH